MIEYSNRAMPSVRRNIAFIQVYRRDNYSGDYLLKRMIYIFLFRFIFYVREVDDPFESF